MLGPPLGGFITTYFDWRWIFFINIPIGVLGIVLVEPLHPRTSARRRPAARLSSASCSRASGSPLLMLGLRDRRAHLVPDASSRSPASSSAPSASSLYVLHARRTPHPVMRPRACCASRPSAPSVLGGSLFRIGIGAIPFLLPLMLQLGFGLTPLQSGSLTFVVGGRRAVHEDAGGARPANRSASARVLIVNALIGAAFIGRERAVHARARRIGSS